MEDSTVKDKNQKTPPKIIEGRRLIFDDFEFLPSSQQLFYRSAPCHLEPKMLNLLSILIESRPNLVTKETLMAELWPDSEVSDWSLARLVSDTRKLIEDNGKSQSVIKTFRGKGFAFVAQTDEIIDAYPNSEIKESNSKNREQTSDRKRELTDNGSPKVKNISSLVQSRFFWFVLFFLFLSFFAFQFFPTSSPTDSVSHSFNQHDSIEHQIEVMRDIQKNLQLTKTAFLAQLKRRNQLGESLLAKKPQLEAQTWEQRIRQAYADFDENEIFLFQQIKAITQGPLNEGNSAILELIKKHPELLELNKTFIQLNSHLTLWKSKYEHVFSKRDDMALVYVGVEDGVPFPSGIDSIVDDWLVENTNDK